jgi:hypothetical protein
MPYETMWWLRNSYPERKQVVTAASLSGSHPVVHWIDDRNEAARLGVSVEELLVARAVAKAFVVDDEPSTVSLLGYQLIVPSPRYHCQIVGIK